jgi:hypothetical protein
MEAIGRAGLRIWISETQDVPGEIRPRIASEIEFYWLVASDKPDASGEAILLPVVDFAVGYLFVDAPCHVGRLMPNPGYAKRAGRHIPDLISLRSR